MRARATSRAGARRRNLFGFGSRKKSAPPKVTPVLRAEARRAGENGVSFRDWLSYRGFEWLSAPSSLHDAYEVGKRTRETKESRSRERTEARIEREAMAEARRQAKAWKRAGRKEGMKRMPGERALADAFASGADSLEEAMRIAGWKQNPTDRALRYRAQRNIPPHEKRCAFCGALPQHTRLMVAHVDGNESHDEPDNLTWTCRPCNSVASVTMQNAGVGRLTHQYNPSKSGGASNVGEWIQAVGAITPRVDRGDRGLSSTMSVSEAVAMIRATPHSKRSQFASQLRKHMSRRASERWNPAEDPEEQLHLIREAQTSRSIEELSRLHKHAIRTRNVELKLAVELRAAELKFKHSDLTKRHGWELMNPAKFDRCVKAVKKHGGAVNAYAVCKASLKSKRNAMTIVPLGLYDIQQLDQTAKGIYSGLKRNGRRNPLETATEMYESFHGRPSEKITEVEETVHFHAALAELGELLELRVISSVDRDVVYLKNFEGALLCSNEAGTQLYIRGGDQAVDLEEFGFDLAHDHYDLGEVKQIRYFTTKDHLGSQGGEAEYYHDFGEDDVAEGRKARRPRLMYSACDHLLSLVGGAYEVKPEGIAN